MSKAFSINFDLENYLRSKKLTVFGVIHKGCPGCRGVGGTSILGQNWTKITRGVGVINEIGRPKSVLIKISKLNKKNFQILAKKSKKIIILNYTIEKICTL